MAKAKPKSVHVAKRLFLDNPGHLESQKVPDGFKTNWVGGAIACIADPLVPVVVWMQNEGELPCGLEWLCRCDEENVWYVRKVEDDPREVPLD